MDILPDFTDSFASRRTVPRSAGGKTVISEAFLYIIVDKRTYILYNECNRS